MRELLCVILLAVLVAAVCYFCIPHNDPTAFFALPEPRLAAKDPNKWNKMSIPYEVGEELVIIGNMNDVKPSVASSNTTTR